MDNETAPSPEPKPKAMPTLREQLVQFADCKPDARRKFWLEHPEIQAVVSEANVHV